MRENLSFFTTFLKHPFSVGAVAPSSRRLGFRMLEGMDLDSARTVVELGPGTGAFTRVILDRIPTEARYLALELNERFAERLRERYRQIHVVHDSAERLGEHLEALGESRADCIFCGLPWASFTPGLQGRILHAVVENLAPGGRFATFAYVHAAWLPTARRFHRLLRDGFRSVRPSRVVWRNLPPAFVYHCER
jgi:phospholipid N-methyltransferase